MGVREKTGGRPPRASRRRNRSAQAPGARVRPGRLSTPRSGRECSNERVCAGSVPAAPRDRRRRHHPVETATQRAAGPSVSVRHARGGRLSTRAVVSERARADGGRRATDPGAASTVTGSFTATLTRTGRPTAPGAPTPPAARAPAWRRFASGANGRRPPCAPSPRRCRARSGPPPTTPPLHSPPA